MMGRTFGVLLLLEADKVSKIEFPDQNMNTVVLALSRPLADGSDVDQWKHTAETRDLVVSQTVKSDD